MDNKILHVLLITPPPQNVWGSYNGFALSRPSVDRSVRLHYRVRFINPIQMKDFLQTWLKFSPQQGDVQNPCCPCVSSRSRSQLKVKYQTIKYWTLCRVRSVSPTLIEIFFIILAQMCTSTRGCAEPMLPFYRLMVKVTFEGQILT